MNDEERNTSEETPDDGGRHTHHEDDARQNLVEARTRSLERRLEPGSMLYESILEVKSTLLTLREDFVNFKEHDFAELTKHVNHEIDVLTTALDNKIDSNELLTSLGFNLLNHRVVRWITGVIGVTVFSTVVVNHWIGPFWSNVVQGLFHFLSRS